MNNKLSNFQLIDKDADITLKEYTVKYEIDELVNILWSMFKTQKSAINHGYTEEEYQ